MVLMGLWRGMAPVHHSSMGQLHLYNQPVLEPMLTATVHRRMITQHNRPPRHLWLLPLQCSIIRDLPRPSSPRLHKQGIVIPPQPLPSEIPKFPIARIALALYIDIPSKCQDIRQEGEVFGTPRAQMQIRRRTISPLVIGIPRHPDFEEHLSAWHDGHHDRYIQISILTKYRRTTRWLDGLQLKDDGLVSGDEGKKRTTSESWLEQRWIRTMSTGLRPIIC